MGKRGRPKGVVPKSEDLVMTPKQARFARAVLDGKRPSDALRAAGYAPAVQASNVRKGRALREYFASLMPPPEAVAAVLTDGLSASKTEFIHWKDGKGGEETRAMQLVDYRERREYARLISNYAGLPEVEKLEIGPTDEVFELQVISASRIGREK